MDLLSIKNADQSSTGVTIELLHPATGEIIEDAKGTPFSAKLLGQDSKQYRQLVNARIRKMQNQQAKRGKAPVRTIEEIAKEDAEELAALTLELYVLEDKDGKKVAQTKEEYERIYLDYPWIREQLNEVLRDRSAFFTG